MPELWAETLDGQPEAVVRLPFGQVCPKGRREGDGSPGHGGKQGDSTVFVRALRLPDVRRRLLVTLLAVLVFRLGQNVPLPGVDPTALAAAERTEGQLPGLLDLLSGGGLANLSILALGVLPVIAAHWTVAFGGLLVPRMRSLAEAGRAGEAELARVARWAAVLWSAVLATVVVRMTADGRPPLADLPAVGAGTGVLHATGTLAQITLVVCMTAGTAVVMWLSGTITHRGFGEGISVLLLAQVAAVFPGQVRDAVRSSGGWAGAWVAPVLLVALALAVALVVTVRRSERRVPVQYAKRMIGRRAYGGSTAYVPIRGGSGFGTMTVASLLFLLPVVPAPWLLVAYAVVVFASAFLRAGLAFNAVDVADDMKRSGGFVPGIRPGRPTAEYLSYVHVRIVFAAALGMTVVALIPVGVLALPGLPGPHARDAAFGVTALLVVVRLAHDTVLPALRQIESRLLVPDEERLHGLG
ncbi:hypothetical protein OG897_33725 [Streptomyces sp. NBC_00237]|uniref:preprotein translocase subunit SecY n=1 Tax=Streptomyces sp. NBC_00237 TaxID=2975687 RepID=UPI00225441F8|nr:hypothetical protein [Streptomyces sp. NBC_00237]MCX5206354.1 hypothetical protein [Streptomyces sp. NBC_00237]